MTTHPFRIEAREYLTHKTVTREQHDEIVATKGRPFTQDPIGTYRRRPDTDERTT